MYIYTVSLINKNTNEIISQSTTWKQRGAEIFAQLIKNHLEKIYANCQGSTDQFIEQTINKALEQGYYEDKIENIEIIIQCSFAAI